MSSSTIEPELTPAQKHAKVIRRTIAQLNGDMARVYGNPQLEALTAERGALEVLKLAQRMPK